MPTPRSDSTPHCDRAPYVAAFFALYSAQRFFVASMMRFRPAALSFRFLVAGFADGASLTFFAAAYLLRCASAIRARVSALNRRRLRAGGASAADSVGTVSVDAADMVAADLGGRPLRFCPAAPMPSMERTCSIWCSIACLCASNPARAALSISGLKLRCVLACNPIMTQNDSHGYELCLNTNATLGTSASGTPTLWCAFGY